MSEQQDQPIVDPWPHPTNVIREGQSVVEFHQRGEKVAEINFTKIFEVLFDHFAERWRQQ